MKVNLFDPDFLADPYPAYAWLREHYTHGVQQGSDWIAQLSPHMPVLATPMNMMEIWRAVPSTCDWYANRSAGPTDW